MQSYHCGALSLRSPPGAPSWVGFSRAPPPWCVPPWGVPCRRGVYRAAVGVYRAAVGSAQLARRGGKSTSAGRPIPPSWGLTVVFGVCPARAPRWREHQRSPPHFPWWGLTGRVKSAQLTNFSPRPAHQLHSGHSSPTSLRTQLARTVKKSAQLHTSSSPPKLLRRLSACIFADDKHCSDISPVHQSNLKNFQYGKR